LYIVAEKKIPDSLYSRDAPTITGREQAGMMSEKNFLSFNETCALSLPEELL
jgi:hypothetical protein